MKHQPTAEEPRKAALVFTEEAYDADGLWELLKEYHDNAALLGASLMERGAERGEGERKRPDGLLTNHAYSVIQVAETGGGFRLLQLRNPWGRFEWNGAWSDDSALWDEHPAVQLELWPERGRGADEGGGGDDGVFWMDFESFCEIFTDIECCDRSTGLHDLALSVDGDDNSACGLCLSCVGGCAGYWCLCRGCRALYLAHESGWRTRTVRSRGCLSVASSAVRWAWAALVTAHAHAKRCCSWATTARSPPSAEDLV